MKFLLYFTLILAFSTSNLHNSFGQDILVYDHNTNNGYAVTAANNLGNVTVGNRNNFYTLLNSQTWDLVMVDCPSTLPTTGWDELSNYVLAGNKVVMSYWDWDLSSQNFPSLQNAFGYTGTETMSLSNGNDTLTTANNALANDIFSGVPGMSHFEWFNSWGDDGDAFMFLGGTPLAFISDHVEPVMITNGNTIAAFVIDEWQGPGAVELWEGMGRFLLQGSTAKIPTMSQWGLFLFSLTIICLGTVGVWNVYSLQKDILV